MIRDLYIWADRHIWRIIAVLACVVCLLVGVLLGVGAGGGSVLQVLHVQDPPRVVTHTVTRPGSTVTVMREGKASTVTTPGTTVTVMSTSQPSTSTVTSTVTSTATTTETAPASTQPATTQP